MDNVQVALPKAVYSEADHSSLLLYLLSYPIEAYGVARNLGFTGAPQGTILPEHQTLEEWYTALAFQFWLASQAHTKKSGSRDAAIFLKHSFPSIPTLGDLVMELAEEVGHRAADWM